MAKTASDLLTSIKRRGQNPSDGGQTLTDDDILAMASDEIENVIAPRLHGNRGWYQAVSKSYTLTSSRSYRIPTRAIGASIVSVEVNDAGSSNESDYRFLPLQHPLQSKRAISEGYYIYGNNIVLLDSAPSAGLMRVKYLLNISRLYTKTNTVASVTATTIVLTALNSFDGSAPFDVDVCYADSPYEVFTQDLTVTSISLSGGVLKVLNVASTTGIVAGMLVYDAGKTNRPQLPDALHDYLAQRSLLRIAEALGHQEDAKAYLQKLSDMEAAFDRQTSPRARGDAKAIISDDRLIDWRF